MDEYIRREDVIAWFMPYAHVGESIDADVVISDIKGMKATVPAADAQGIKERIAMDIERYGDCKVVSIVSDLGREEQLRMKGAKL